MATLQLRGEGAPRRFDDRTKRDAARAFVGYFANADDSVLRGFLYGPLPYGLTAAAALWFALRRRG